MIRLQRGRKGWAKGRRKKREKHTHQFFMASRCSWTERRGREVNARNGGRFFFLNAGNLAPFFLGVFTCWLNFTRKARRRLFFFPIDPQLLLQGSSACFKLVKSTVHWIPASAFDYLWCYGNHRSANREKRSSFVQVTRSQELAYMCVPCTVKCTIYATVRVTLWVTQRAGFGGHRSRKSVTERLQQFEKGNTFQLNQLIKTTVASNKNLMY